MGYGRIRESYLSASICLGAVSHSPSIVTMAIAAFPRQSEILVENRDFFHILLAFDAPVRRVLVVILPSRLVRKNNGGGGYLMVKKL